MELVTHDLMNEITSWIHNDKDNLRLDTKQQVVALIDEVKFKIVLQKWITFQ